MTTTTTASNNPYHDKNSTSRRRRFCCCVLKKATIPLLAVMAVYCNYHYSSLSTNRTTMMTSTSTNTRNNKKNGEEWPLLLAEQLEYPSSALAAITNNNMRQVVQKWSAWAKEPMVGSYTYAVVVGNHKNNHKNNHHKHNNKEEVLLALHFPPVDLESVWGKNNNKDSPISTTAFSSSLLRNMGNGSSSLATTTITPQQQPPADNIIVATRRGNKYSQGEADAAAAAGEGGGDLDSFDVPSTTYRQPNQDRVALMTRTTRRHVSIGGGGGSNGKKDNTNNNYHDGDGDENNDFWIGLFDGHGPYGHCISQYCSLEFARHIRNEWEKEVAATGTRPSKATVKDAIQNIFLSINDAMPRLFGSGSTGISIWRRGHDLYVSNVGDSVAFVASYEKDYPPTSKEPKVEIVYATTPHKPDSPAERKRIEAAGGRVEDPPFPGATARLVIPMPDGFQVFGLAMSRSLGDHDGAKVGLLAEPTTDVLDLSTFDTKNKEYMVIAATDGVIDYGRLSEMDVAKAMAKAFLSSSNLSSSSDAPAAAADQLILKASEMWAADAMLQGYRDDESIVVRRLVL